MYNGPQKSYQFFPLGDSAILVDFGNSIDESINRQVLSFFKVLQDARLPWITDLVPAYSSLAIFYDVMHLADTFNGGNGIYEHVAKQIQNILLEAESLPAKPRRQLRIPVCYEKVYAPDLEEVAHHSGLSVEEVIDIHTSTPFRVYMIGFLPGFAYMGEVPEAIAIARRSQPRITVPAGSVGIAGKQTGIYPFDSPGGWQLIGKTPISLFEKEDASPTFFEPADEVFFYPITSHEFIHYKDRVI